MGSRAFLDYTIVMISILCKILRQFVKKGGFTLSALSTVKWKKKAPWPASFQSPFSSFVPPGFSSCHSLEVDSFFFHFWQLSVEFQHSLQCFYSIKDPTAVSASLSVFQLA